MRALVRELPPVTVDPETARDVADRVLAGRAYIEAAKPPSLRERFFSWLGRIFTELFSALTSFGGRGFGAWLIIGFMSIVIIFLLWRFFKTLGLTTKRATDDRPDPSIDISRNLSAEQWLSEAERVEGSGDWRNGLRCRHRSLVTELIDGGLVTARPGQTAGEISDELIARVPDVRSDMSEATWLFKDAWYGWSDPGPVERDRFIAHADSVIRAVQATDRTESSAAQTAAAV